MVEHCLDRGLAPVVTYNHFTSPHWFAACGGWLDRDAPDVFSRYVEQVVTRFGDRIACAITLNEPNLPRLRAAREVTKALRPDLPVGLSVAVVDDVAVGDDASVRDRKRAETYVPWLELARADDFVGVQNYERMRYDGSGVVAPPSGLARNQMGTAVEPGSLAGAVAYAHEVAQVPVLVTEHGIATEDDGLRAGLLEPAVEELLRLRTSGVPLLGYLHWTMLDNFEWVFGYAHQLGLFSVDRTTFARTAKPSAHAYAGLVARMGATTSPGVAP